MAEITSPSIVSTPTKCKLCGKIFGPSLLNDAAILGSNPEAKLKQVQAMMAPLTKHLEKNHPEHIEESQIAGGTFAGYLMMTAFDIDAETHKRLGSDYTRWKIRQMMTRQESRVSDERIAERLRKALETWLPGQGNIPPELYDELFVVMCAMRDVLEERGRYTTEQPAGANPAA